MQQNTALADRLIAPVTELRERALRLEAQYEDEINHLDPGYQASARNLLHYLALRQSDIQPLQRDLTSLGLHSLGGIESYTLSALNAVLVALYDLADRPCRMGCCPANRPLIFAPAPCCLMTVRDFAGYAIRAAERADHGHDAQRGSDKLQKLVRDLVDAGMDLARINCAHDDPVAWQQMVDNVRRAEKELGRQCKVYADLAGPKLRTGDIIPAGRVTALRPNRDLRGRVIATQEVWLTPEDNPEPPPHEGMKTVNLAADFLSQMQQGDSLEFHDTRDQIREFDLESVTGNSAIFHADKTTYIETGSPLILKREGQPVAEGQVGLLPEVVEPLMLYEGDHLVLTRPEELGCAAVRDSKGKVTSPARIPCTLEEAFAKVKPGERIRFDDGKIDGRIFSNDGNEIVVEITRAGNAGAKLKPEKGINLPDSRLVMSSLTPKDLTDLEFMVERADIIGMSFVRTADDVAYLQNKLSELGAAHVGVVLKIENNQAFENLPRLLLTGLRKPPFGIMVARGDLAAEVGFERMAEVQEEILWLCESAHVPVIWATQVLETLARKGSPSRAEVSDAVMSGRAECVMLNKGPYIVQTVDFLNGVLERVSAHFSKQRSRLRRLSISENI
ncbi:MAG: pyruvate kinase [Chloroflexota bacterium]